MRADPSLLDDLLSNLVDNALKYTPAGGSVTVSAGERMASPILRVEDTGPGIPESERPTRPPTLLSDAEFAGTWQRLGLAIVDEIAHLYDAVMSISGGANGIGTKVTLQFQSAGRALE